jgi:hypothetical protein
MFNIFTNLSCLSHSLSYLCVACIYMLIYRIVCLISAYASWGEGGGLGGCTKIKGKFSSAFEKADTSAAYRPCSAFDKGAMNFISDI